MFVHIFAFAWKEQATPQDRERAMREIAALPEQIPQVLSLWLGDNVSANAPAYSTSGVMTFADADSYQAYTRHPAHLALLDWLVPLIEALEIDFTAA